MKPLALKMTGFQAYGGTEAIDFRKLGDRGLFLITGNTGAGKTTIFDAITFALYGKTSGSGRSTDTIRSHFADPKADTEVELTFIHRGKTYSVRRNPAYERPRAGGKPGSVTRAKDASIALPDGTAVTGDAAVTREVEAILGLEHRQWAQVVMLAQGEFVRLLNSNSSDRSDILQKIFQTQVYRAIQANLKERFAESNAGLKGLQNDVFAKVNDIECEEGSAHYAAVMGLKGDYDRIYDMDGVLGALEGMAGEDEAKLSALSEGLRSAEKERDALIREKNNAEGLARDFEELGRLSAELSGIDAGRGAAEELRHKLERSERALNFVKPVYDNSTDAKKKMREKEGQIDAIRRAIGELEPRLERAMEEWAAKKAEALAVPGIIREMADIDSVLPNYAELTEKTGRAGAERRELVALSEKRAALAKERDDGSNSKREHIEFITPRRRCKDDFHDAKTACNKSADELEGSRALLEALRTYFKKRSEADNGRADLKALSDRRAEESRALDEAEGALDRSRAGVLAGALEEGMPCPVCGSTHHPSKAAAVDGVPTEEEIKQMRAGKERLEAQAAALREKLAKAEGQLAETEAGISKDAARLSIPPLDFSDEGRCLATVSENIANIEKKASEDNRRRLELEGIVWEFDSRSEALEKIDLRVIGLSDAISEMDPLIAEKSATVQTLEESIRLISGGLTYGSESEAIGAKQALSNKRDMLEEAEKRARGAWEALNGEMIADKAKLEAAREELDQASEKGGELEAELKKAMLEQGFADEADFTGSLMDRAALEGEKRKMRESEEKRNILISKVESLSSKLEGQERPDAAGIEARYKEAEAKRARLLDEKSAASARKNNNDRVVSRLRELYSEMGDAERRTAELKALSETANGQRGVGPGKVNFEQYVQGVYFDEVVGRASRRLGMMTNNRFVLIRKMQADDMRSNTSLDLEILDNHSGKTRSVKSLSGGESFKAALSLALGLSDMIQTTSAGVDIDTLFIDEGFGSLDSESLDQAIGVLEQLSDDDTLVGIVSHVESLKERLNKKIIVTYDEKGSRTEVVVD
ncbi:MAG: SMC family ATPase [Methanomassiliicoccaceae archaeon]|nr:SMC family ATPase [Methanomassiliicoccaceae archaeon]